MAAAVGERLKVGEWLGLAELDGLCVGDRVATRVWVLDPRSTHPKKWKCAKCAN